MRVHVVAGVIRDAQQRVLVTQHIKRDRYRGQWEFPGGKVESGESEAGALARELAEELGIHTQVCEPLIEICHDYPDIRVRLSVLEVREFAGDPEGREGQPLRWVSNRELNDLNLLEANWPIVRALALPAHYVITDTKRYGVTATLAGLERLLAEGLRLVQVREKHMTVPDYTRFTRAVIERCQPFGAWVLGNVDPPVAVAAGAHGVHLDSRRLRGLDRRPLGSESWVAASCHDRRELEHAARIGCDFVVLSPVQPTASHTGARPLGWSRFRALSRRANFPVYALGGMQWQDASRARQAGGQGVALISAAWQR